MLFSVSSTVVPLARQGLAALTDLVYPPQCLLCDDALPALSSTAFCSTCIQKLHLLSGTKCPRCAAPYPALQPGTTSCPHCHEETFAFTSVHAWGGYDAGLRDIILKIKDERYEALAYHAGVLLAQKLLPELQSEPVDAILPVPLHWIRRLWRGYNQAQTLAQAVAHQLHVPVHSNCLWRTLMTPPQSSLTPLQRRKNLQQAMKARLPRSLQGKRLLLVDDVMTTGATAHACAQALVSAGAGSVRVLVLARAIGENARSLTPGTT